MKEKKRFRKVIEEDGYLWISLLGFSNSIFSVIAFYGLINNLLWTLPFFIFAVLGFIILLGTIGDSLSSMKVYYVEI